MKKMRLFKAFIITAVLAIAFAAMYLVPATAQPGDAGDPLVTRSFVENRIAQLANEISHLRNTVNSLAPGSVNIPIPGQGISQADRDALFAEFALYFEQTYGNMIRAAASGNQQAGATAEVVPFTILLIPAGHTFFAEEGVEFILRAGHATAVTGVDGMVDVTAGRDVINGELIPANHLLLVPRTDGRGFLANTDVWLMVKGRYQIVG